MSDESRQPDRLLREEEKALLATLLGASLNAIDERLKTNVVEDMTDGGMGSIRFVYEPRAGRSLGKVIAEAEYLDTDGVVVSIVVNIDDRGELYEVDFWKVDFSPLREYPTPQRLRLKARG